MADPRPRSDGRIPPGVTIQQWVEKQIRDGSAAGAFDDLPGAGKPLQLAEHHDEDWWIKQKIRDEGLEVLPPSLILRRDIERAVREARGAPTEAEARRQIEVVNDRIRAANRVAIAGPPVNLVAYDVDELLDLWRAAHPLDPQPPVEAPDGAEPSVDPGAHRRWRLRWRRIESADGRPAASAGRRRP